MATLNHSLHTPPAAPALVVVHPLDDAPETKLETAALGRMPLARGARVWLGLPRGYLLFMAGVVGYHVISLAGHSH